MRALAIVLAGAALLTGAARGADPSPRALVLGHSDVPRGFVLDPTGSGFRTNAAEAKTHPPLRSLFRRWGRITGYEVEYDRGEAKIEARTDLLRTAAGAREMLAWYDREVRKAGLQGLRRTAGDVGDQAWVYSSPKPQTTLRIVVWRQGRVFSGVLGQGIPHAVTLRLARAQQQRIVAALG